LEKIGPVILFSAPLTLEHLSWSQGNYEPV